MGNHLSTRFPVEVTQSRREGFVRGGVPSVRRRACRKRFFCSPATSGGGVCVLTLGMSFGGSASTTLFASLTNSWLFTLGFGHDEQTPIGGRQGVKVLSVTFTPTGDGTRPQCNFRGMYGVVLTPSSGKTAGQNSLRYR